VLDLGCCRFQFQGAAKDGPIKARAAH
jgi:hypothetical protein